MEFIQNLLKVMQNKNITIYKMSKDIGMAQSTINSWKNDKYPTIDKLLKICRYLEVSADVLLGIQQEECFTEKEKNLVKKYKNLPSEEQEEVERIIDIKLEKIQKKTTLSNSNSSGEETEKIG